MKKYETEIRVIYADTDAMGIVYHTNYIKWFEIGRNELLRNMGYPYSRLEQEGIWLPVASVNCEYKTPARYDDVLCIRAWIQDLGAATVLLGYEISNKEAGKLHVKGTTRHGITSPTLKPIRLKKVDPELYARLSQDLD